MLGAHCITLSTVSRIRNEARVIYNRNRLVCIYSVVRDHTAEAVYSFDRALNATRRKGTPGLRPHRARQQVLHHRANDARLCLHITRAAYALCGFLTMPSRHPLHTSKSTISFGIILMERIISFSKCITNWHAIPDYNPSSFRDTGKDRGKPGLGTKQNIASRNKMSCKHWESL